MNPLRAGHEVNTFLKKRDQKHETSERKNISFDICWHWAEARGGGDTVMRDGWTAVAPTF